MRRGEREESFSLNFDLYSDLFAPWFALAETLELSTLLKTEEQHKCNIIHMLGIDCT